MDSKKIIAICFTLVALYSCSYEFPEIEQPANKDLGTINPENFLAVGDDYMAGLMDGALYSGGQANSVAAILATQLNKMDTVSFCQAEINSKNGLNLYVENEIDNAGKWIYQFVNTTAEQPEKVLTAGENIKTFDGDKNQLNDLSIPLLRVGQVNNPELKNNPFYERMINSGGNATLVSEIVKRNPTFMFLWLGMNDIIEFAIQGATGNENDAGEIVDKNPNLTSEESFRNNFTAFTEYLLNNTESKIIIGNLISVKSLPFFYLQPYDGLFLTGNKLGAARNKYKQFNEAVAEYNRQVAPELQRPFIDFFDNGYLPHPQPLVVIDNTLVDATYPDGKPLEKYRQLTKNEMVFIRITNNMKEQGYGSVIPIEPNSYLNETEINLIESRIQSFNEIIISVVQSYPEHMAIADINAGIEPVATSGKVDAWGDPIYNVEPIYFDGVPVEGSLDMYSIFSLDGLHFNKRGNAFVTNLYIKVMNDEFGSEIPQININEFTGNVYTFSY